MNYVEILVYSKMNQNIIFGYPWFWNYWKALSLFSGQTLLQPHITVKGCNWLSIAWNATFFVFRWKSFFEQKLLSIATNKSAHFKHNNLEVLQWLMTIFTSANKWESFEDLLWYSTWTKSTLGDKKVSNLLSVHKKIICFII